MEPGDVVVFRGDQKHGYRNAGPGLAVAYSVITFAPIPGISIRGPVISPAKPGREGKPESRHEGLKY